MYPKLRAVGLLQQIKKKGLHATTIKSMYS